ncbi:MAG: heme exporter protein CcmD [Burkholderiales bacterium]
MNWGSAAAFFAMGGYAPFVWGSFAVVALCMIVEPLVVRARRRRARGALKRVGLTARRVGHEAAA